MMPNDWQQEKASFNLWMAENGEDNHASIDRMKQMLPIALKECCTEKQRLYISHFFTDRMSMREIAALYGVNNGTVSRVIWTGLRRMHAHLKFCSPELCVNMKKQGRLTQKKIGPKWARESAESDCVGDFIRSLDKRGPWK